MKIPGFCPICMKGKRAKTLYFNYNDDLILDIRECSNGHKVHGVLFAPKFELFLTCGAEALINGYSVEASFNFAAAREHLFMFAIKVMLNYDSFDNGTTKKYRAQYLDLSERILGGFGTLYLLNYGKSFDIMKEDIIGGLCVNRGNF